MGEQKGDFNRDIETLKKEQNRNSRTERYNT